MDKLLAGLNSALTTVVRPANRATRPNPAADISESKLTYKEKAHAAGLMRVNHAGEVAAQGLYQGHGAVSRNPEIADQMREAADEAPTATCATGGRKKIPRFAPP